MKATPCTIWITGLAASGKTTLSRYLTEALRKEGIANVELFDGEDVRSRLSRKYGYSTEERIQLVSEIARMANESNEKGNVAVVATISHIRKARETARQHIPRFMEVYLDCSADQCAARDYKGHYEKARKGLYDNFIGVTEPYEPSVAPELVLKTGTEAVGECERKLLDAALRFIKNGS